jgi:Secretion system C-terminal sorting domain
MTSKILSGKNPRTGVSLLRRVCDNCFRTAGLLLLFVFLTATKGNATTTVSLSTPAPLAAASMCPGTVQQPLYSFTLIATGIFPNTTLTGISFNQIGTALTGDVVMYQLWSGSIGGTLVASSTTASFTGLSTVYSGVFGTTINYFITADIASNAVAGRTLLVDAMTTANFTTSSGFRTTFGTIAVGAAQTVLLAPAAITGADNICVAASATLGNAITGGTWTSGATSLATVDPSTGLVTGVSDGPLVITYQLATGCFTTRNEVINPLPNLYSVTGGGAYCAGGTGVHVGLSGSQTGVYYQLYTGVLPTGDPEGIGAPIDFGLQTVAGPYTVIATNNTTSCTRNMAGAATVYINPLPASYLVTGGGTYCAGDPGFHVGLSGSNTGINYRLYRDGIAIGSLTAGLGTALDFGVFTTPGNYTVKATNAATLCNNDMSGSAAINVNPLPNNYFVLGGGTFCAGDAGVHVRLSWSQTGVIYVLYNGTTTVGTPVAGTGFLLDLGLQTAPGTYTVEAINATTYCSRMMSGSATVIVNPVPSVQSVTGGGSYCAEGAGVHVGLAASQSGIMYMLYNGATLTGSPATGTGASVDFGLQTSPGTYTVVGVNSGTTCMNNMAGFATVRINPLPTVATMSGGGSYCAGGAGVHLGLATSETGVSYQLWNSGSPVGSPVAGTGASLDLGLQTIAGIYTTVATNTSTMCINNMAGSASVNINPLPAVYNVTGGGNYCTSFPVSSTISETEAGATSHHIGLDGSDVGMIYLLYNGTSTVGSPMAGTGSALDFGVQYASGTYTVLAMNSITLCTQVMAGTGVITINHTVTPSVTIIQTTGDVTCEGRTATFNTLVANAGMSPSCVWKVNGTVVGGSTVSYSYVPVNGDVVSFTLTSSALCALPATVTSSVTEVVIPPVVPAVDISVYPGTTIGLGQLVSFTAEVTAGGTVPQYQWFVNHTAILAATSPVFVSSSLQNNDTISCTVTRNDACAMSSSHSVVVTVINVGVQSVSAGGNITVMPNPCNGTFTISGALASAVTTEVALDIVNMTGQVVYRQTITAAGGKLNEQVKLNNLPAGMYMLNIRSASGNITMRVMIE